MIKLGDRVAAREGHPYAGRIGKVVRIERGQTHDEDDIFVRVPKRGNLEPAVYGVRPENLMTQEELPDVEESAEKTLSARTTLTHRVEALENTVCELSGILLAVWGAEESQYYTATRDWLREQSLRCKKR